MKSCFYRKELEPLNPRIPTESVESIQKKLGLQELVKLNSNETTLGPSEKALKVIKKELKKIKFISG